MDFSCDAMLAGGASVSASEPGVSVIDLSPGE
jgi:hypothetical protein